MFKDQIIRLITFDYYFIKQVIVKEIGFLKNSAVLDLGCGTGTLSGLFNKEEYLGVDIDKDSINLARKKNKEYLYKIDDATTFRNKKKYDLVLIVGVLHHLNDSDVKKILKTISLHTKKGGKVVIIEAIPPIYKINFVGWILRKLDRGHHVRKLEEYEKLIKNLKLLDSFEKRAGIVDYGVLYISN